MNKILPFIFPVVLILLFLVISPSAESQIKLKDRKSIAFKENKKNKNKKQRKRIATYRKSSKENQTQGVTDLVPKALQEQYTPKTQNAEKNPSKAFLDVQKKEKRTVARKAVEAQHQGMNLGLTSKGQVNKARKQSRRIAKHQGDIPFVPLALREKPGAVPQPQVDKNPARSSLKTRNQKLAMYSRKSEEAQYQGMSVNKPNKDNSAKSKEGLKQGQVKGLGNKGDQQISLSQALVQSQFQGNIQVNARQKEGKYAHKSRQAQKAGLKPALNVKQKEAEYMAKSVESQGQGMLKSISKNKQQITGFEKSLNVQSQGLYRVKSKSGQERTSRRNSNTISNDQGSLKGQSLKMKQENQVGNSLSQSQFQGNIKSEGQKNIESKYSRKSADIRKAGLVSGISVNKKDGGYMNKSIEGLSQGMMKGQGRKQTNAKYAQKSKETLDQGTFYGITEGERIQEMIGTSLVQSQFRGDVKSPGKKTFESQYIKKNVQAGKVGLISSLTVQQKDAGYMAKSIEGLGQGIVKIKSRNLPGSQFLRKSIEAQDQGMVKSKGANKPGSQYAQKSQEAMDQGMMKGTTKKGRDQELMSKSIDQSQYQGNLKSISPGKIQSNSLAKSQYQGDIALNLKRRNESKYIRKSQEALNSGKISGLTIQQKESAYMAKSIEGLNQGMMKGYSRKNIESLYTKKAIEALDQGVMKGNTKKGNNQEIMTKTVPQSQFQGNLKGISAGKIQGGYANKSAEGLSQGLLKVKTQRKQQQELKSNSIAKSQYQGDIAGNLKNRNESNYIRKSQEALNSGKISGLTVQQKEAAYMAKSIEGLDQGLMKGYSTRKMESQYIRKSMEILDQGMVKGKTIQDQNQQFGRNSQNQTQFQGNISGLTTKKMNSIFARKSKEALDQGVMKGTSKKGTDQQLMSKTVVQTQFQGNIAGMTSKNLKSGFMRKSAQAQKTGMVAGLSARKIDRIMRYNQSIELKQGLVKGLSKKDNEQIFKSSNMMYSQYMGDLKSQTRANLTSRYIRQSIQIQNAGLTRGKTERSIENNLKQKSNDVTGYRGEDRSYTATISILKDWKDSRSQAKNLRIIGDFKVRTKLFANIYNLRSSSRQAKYYGMDRESNVERWWADLWKKPVDQRKAPAPLRKPRYDPKEHEIWNY